MKSIIREKAEKDPAFCPDCTKCNKKTKRAKPTNRYKWYCFRCKTIYDENLLKVIKKTVPDSISYWYWQIDPENRPELIDHEFRDNILFALSNKLNKNEK